MLKFAIRRNLIYPMQYLLWTVLRDVESYLIGYFLDLNNLFIYTPLMFLGELLAGLIFYLYQKQFFSKNKIKKFSHFFTPEFIKSKQDLAKDGKITIIFIIFSIGLYDFIQFFLSFPISKFITISGSLEQRLRGTFTITTALFYYYILRLPIFKHQLFSLVIIGICVLIVIITEFIFQEFNIFLSYGQFIIVLVFIFLMQFFCSLEQSIEKYLFEYNQLNPFLVLMIEGIFGFIFCFIYSFFQNPFDDIIQFKNSKSTSEFSVLILGLILYVVLSGGKNIFRVVTTKIYSPMTTTFIEYIFNPFYFIYYFASGNDFKSFGKRNYVYFIINLIISFFMTIFGGVYNEFLILFCCGLERNTHSQVIKRADDEKDFNILLDNDEEQESVTSGYVIPMKNI